MTHRFIPSHTICATCEFWSGPREMNNNRSQVSVEGDATGKCFVGATPVPRRMSNNCPKWKKWAVFKN